MRYLDFLQAIAKLVAKFGPGVLAAWPHFLKGFEELFRQSGERLLGAEPPTVAEQSAEDEVVAMVYGDLLMGESLESGAFERGIDGSRLRNLWQLVKDNPELLKILLALIA